MLFSPKKLFLGIVQDVSENPENSQENIYLPLLLV